MFLSLLRGWIGQNMLFLFLMRSWRGQNIKFLFLMQRWNLSQTLHGHIFLEKVLPQNIAWVTTFLAMKKTNIYRLCYLNILLCTCLYLCYSIFAIMDKKYKNFFKIAKTREFTTNRVCSKLYFTQGRSKFKRTMSVHPWKIPCLSLWEIFAFGMMRSP